MLFRVAPEVLDPTKKTQIFKKIYLFSNIISFQVNTLFLAKQWLTTEPFFSSLETENFPRGLNLADKVYEVAIQISIR